MSLIAKTPLPPYYAVIFTSILSEEDHNYTQMAEKMLALAAKQGGFLGVESTRQELGITVSYWSDLESIKVWKENIDHKEAQRLGREKWYTDFKIRIAKVEREYGI
ncbi:MAG: antibiotic biosynthesis monooxygenase [Deltaproteobacteria bacterium]|nr:antibiotic biosynthesis monooxygenase [Deltaproteobacteria bacterium]